MTYANPSDFENEGKGSRLFTFGITVAGAAIGTAGTWYALTDLFPNWSAEAANIPAWIRYSLTNGHDPAAVLRHWYPLANSFFPLYLSGLGAGTALGGGLAAVVATDRPLEQAMGPIAGMGILGGMGTYLAMPYLAAAPMWQTLAFPLAVAGCGLLGILVTKPRRPTELVRGARVLPGRRTSRQSARAAKKALRKGQVTFGGLPLSRRAETRHGVMLGVTGSGKSVAILQLIAAFVKRGDRAVIADPDGDAMSVFWRDDDVILNPEDVRSVRWDVFAELRREGDYKRFAAALMPDEKSDDNNKWVDDGRAVLAAALKAFHRHQLGTQEDLAAILAADDSERLKVLCGGTGAARYFAPGNEKMLGSVLATLRKPADTLLLASRGQGPSFSIRKWVRRVRQEGIGHDGTLWLPYRADQVPLLRDAFASWLAVAMGEVLSLPINPLRRVWFVIDELDQLGRITDIELAMTKGRKKGAAVYLGYQSISQLRHHYGREVADTINEQCGNRLILRCDTSEGGGTARFASELIGDREIAREEQTHSRTVAERSSRSTSTAERRRIERAVLPAEIAQLPDCEGYARVHGTPAWTRTRYRPQDRDAVVEEFMPLEDGDGDWFRDAAE